MCWHSASTKGEIGTFFVISILLTSNYRMSASSCRIDVVDSLADVSQVEINLDPLRGHISEFRLDPDHHHAVVLDDSALPYQSSGTRNPPLDTFMYS